MTRKLYPADQIEKYLILDVVIFIFLFYNVLTTDSPFGRVVTLVLLCLFLLAFYIGLWCRDWRLLASSFFGCGILVIFGAFYNQWFLLYAFIFADLLGRTRSLVHMCLGMSGFIVMEAVTHWLLTGDPLSFVHTIHLPILILLLIVPFIVRITERSKSLKRELATANKKIERYIQEEERHRIARDLHDTLGQTLTMIKMKSELAARLIGTDADLAKQEMNEVIHTSRFALKQVRELVTSMKYVALDEEIKHARKLLDSLDIQLHVRQSASLHNLSKVTETMLALCLRECLTNIVKHSQAKICMITGEMTNEWFELHIEDDGVGFSRGDTDGNGLASIQERMRLLKGHAELGASSHGGVSVTLRLPVNEQERGNSQ